MRTRLLLVLAMVAGGLVACGPQPAPPEAPPDTAPPPAVTETPKEPEQVVNIGNAAFDKFAEDGSEEKLWTVRWKSAIATIYDEGDFSGRMLEVTGSIYRDADEISTFSANEGSAEKRSEVLTLTGNVTITAKESGARMRCQKVVYEAKKNLIRASGDVRVEGKQGLISGINELWTTPELTTVATPDLWEAPR